MEFQRRIFRQAGDDGRDRSEGVRKHVNIAARMLGRDDGERARSVRVVMVVL